MFTKNNDATKGLMLAVETGIQGGSLALIKDGEAIDGWTGNQQISRAEDVLEEIDRILTNNGIEKKSIGTIAISKGPGSFTGLRIGAAIALGLKKSLNCVVTSHSVLESLLVGQNEIEKTICAVPFGKNQICWQYFPESVDSTPDGYSNKIRVSQDEQFGAECEDLNFEKLILQESLYIKLISAKNTELHRTEDFRLHEKKIVRAAENLAGLIGLSAYRTERTDENFTHELIYPQQR